MARRVSRWFVPALTCTALTLGVAALAWAEPSLRVVLRFEGEALELPSGAVVPGPGSAGQAGGDIYVAFNAANEVHAVIFPARDGVETAHLRGVAYEAVDAARAATAAFASPDLPFSTADTVLVRTPDGALFKLGNPTEDEAVVSFDCDRL